METYHLTRCFNWWEFSNNEVNLKVHCLFAVRFAKKTCSIITPEHCFVRFCFLCQQWWLDDISLWLLSSYNLLKSSLIMHSAVTKELPQKTILPPHEANQLCIYWHWSYVFYDCKIFQSFDDAYLELAQRVHLSYIWVTQNLHIHLDLEYFL